MHDGLTLELCEVFRWIDNGSLYCRNLRKYGTPRTRALLRTITERLPMGLFVGTNSGGKDVVVDGRWRIATLYQVFLDKNSRWHYCMDYHDWLLLDANTDDRVIPASVLWNRVAINTWVREKYFSDADINRIESIRNAIRETKVRFAWVYPDDIEKYRRLVP